MKTLLSLFFMLNLFLIQAAFCVETNQANKSLIIYYSLSGNTKAVASILHGLVGGEIEEIKTVYPYPADFEAVVEQTRKERQTKFLPPIQPLKFNPAKYD